VLLGFSRNEPARTAGDRVRVVPGHGATLIDAAPKCGCGSRNVDRGKAAGSQHKRMRAGGIRELTGDAAPVADSTRGCRGGSGTSTVMKLPSSVRM